VGTKGHVAQPVCTYRQGLKMAVEIKDVLDQIVALNINRCASTTYDLSVQECARQEIVKGLAQHYGIQYNIQPKGTQLFPVRGTRA
jgi:hypothetical protein